MRQRYTLTAETRTELVERADALAQKLVATGLDKEDAGALVALAAGETLEWLLELAGIPDPAAEAIGDRVEELAKVVGPQLAAILRPDPEKIMARAVDAMKGGDAKKSRRLMARAERVMARQAARVGA